MSQESAQVRAVEAEKFFQALANAQKDMVCFDAQQLRRLFVVVLSIRDSEVQEILDCRLGDSKGLRTEQALLKMTQPLETPGKAQK